MNKHYRIKVSNTIPNNDDVRRRLTAAAGLMKELMGIANNAAWYACLDAHDQLKALPNWKQRVKGGKTVEENFNAARKAFKAYELRLVYDEQMRFFDVRDMPENTRRMYGERLTNREYYEFWQSTGATAYGRTRPLVTSLWNKYRLALIRNGFEKDAGTMAWGMCGCACLFSAVTVFRQAIRMIHDEYRFSERPLARMFDAFNMEPVARAWVSACESAFPKAMAAELSETDDSNIAMGIEQLQLAWTEGQNIYDDIENTLAECGDDVMRTHGFVDKAVKEVRKIKKIHEEL